MHEIRTQGALAQLLDDAPPGSSLDDVIVVGLDLSPHVDRLLALDLQGLVILGGTLPNAGAGALVAKGALIFPELPELPYEVYRSHLYTPEELYEAFEVSNPETYEGCLDARIYAHWQNTGRDAPVLLEALARRLHDHSIRSAKEHLLRDKNNVVAFMGGHSMLRNSPAYREVVLMARSLARKGFYLVSGGGPGAMEATNLGAYLAEGDDTMLLRALELLSAAPRYDHPNWLEAAYRTREFLGDLKPRESLGIPTWLYGHEPPNPFATHIAKLFQNSVREEGLVSVATRGIVFAPGSAGTVQEIFQDAAQNHYGTVKDLASPMVFLNRDYWNTTLPVMPLLRALADGKPYDALITVGDEPDDLIAWLEANEPQRSS